jgi:hypothetical protein
MTSALKPSYETLFAELAAMTNPTLLQIQRVKRMAPPADREALAEATRQAFGGGLSWHNALENAGLIDKEAR